MQKIPYSTISSGEKMVNPENDPSIEIEIEALKNSNATLATTKYLGDLSLFRADVLLKAQSLDLVDKPDPQWMFFNSRQYFIGESAQENDLLLFFHYYHPHERADIFRPYIRILASEQFEMPYGYEYLTTDVTVDHDDDAQYLVSSFPMVTNEDMLVKKYPTKAPFYFIREGQLSTVNISNFTPFVAAEAVINNKNITVMPFGHYNNLYDRQYSLDIARSLFEQVKNIQPDYCSSD